jgi:large subunit ribosomal protein L21
VYAVFRTGGKQYRASQGQRLRVERLEAAVGDSVEFDEVLIVGQGADIEVGTPLVAGGKVEGKVTVQGRAAKIDIVKFKRRAHYKRVGGHRQHFTEVEITAIMAPGAEPAGKRSSGKAGTPKAAAPETPVDAAPAADAQAAAPEARSASVTE